MDGRGRRLAAEPDICAPKRVPLIEDGVPGSWVTPSGGQLVGRCGGDVANLARGACMRTVEERQFLIYAYFSTVTPSAMARTFQAYQCDYAMLLDMNSQEPTHMVRYAHNGDPDDDGAAIEFQHLVAGITDADPDNGRIARFISAPDNRDFFYILRRQ